MSCLGRMETSHACTQQFALYGLPVVLCLEQLGDLVNAFPVAQINKMLR